MEYISPHVEVYFKFGFHVMEANIWPHLKIFSSSASSKPNNWNIYWNIRFSGSRKRQPTKIKKFNSKQANSVRYYPATSLEQPCHIMHILVAITRAHIQPAHPYANPASGCSLRATSKIRAARAPEEACRVINLVPWELISHEWRKGRGSGGCGGRLLLLLRPRAN